jgi:hypothetical protein
MPLPNEKNNENERGGSVEMSILIIGVMFVILMMCMCGKGKSQSSRLRPTCGRVERLTRVAPSSSVSINNNVRKPKKVAPSAKTERYYNEKDLENFLSERHDVDEVYDMSDPYKAPHGQYTGGDPLADPKHEWDPSKFSLENSVFDSHREFVEDAYVSTQGPNSANSVRDDTNEINKRWGLRRVDYTTIQAGDDARVVHSEYPDQIDQPNAGTFLL